MTGDIKCPICGSETTLRTAKKGTDVGRQFYVCDRYPECKGKIPVDERANAIHKANQATSECQESWLRKFLALYDQISPLINQVAKLDEKGLPPNIDILLKAYAELPPILTSLKSLPKPPEKQFNNMKKDFERLLVACIKAGEMGMKMIDDMRAGAQTAARMHFASVGGYITNATAYHKLLCKQLPSLPK